MRYILNALSALAVVTLLFFSHSTGVLAETQSVTLEQRVARGDGDAFVEAADRNRYDLIPALEKFSDDSTARMALARLGVKKYVDSLVRQLTDPTNSNAYAYYTSREQRDPKTAEYLTKISALRSLLYVHDKSTVRAIVSELDDTNRPPSHSEHIARQAPCEMAVWTLERMGLENAPVVDKVKSGDTRAEQEAFEKWVEEHPGQGPTASLEEHLAAWKKWWEQNKGKYP